MFRFSLKKLAANLVCALFLCVVPVFASISDDARKAVKEYAGYEELVSRGFKLSMLDNIKSLQELYEVLLPYMVVDGKPLDNALSFGGFNFARHKTIHFKNIYGTIGELEKKGYKPEQMFYYPAKGKDIYRIGEFVWENAPPVPNLWNDIVYYDRPFIGKKIAYFFIGSFKENYFNPYLKEIQKKDSIVVDLRLFSGNCEYQIYLLGEALCTANYQGKVILIMDKTTAGESGINNAIREQYYINGSQKKANFKWITVGENTYGKQAFIANAKWNYKVGDLQFNPLPVKKNEWAYGTEGEGYFPEIWAVGEEDINKTIEVLTGEPDFAELTKTVSLWRKYLCSREMLLGDWKLQLPESVKKIKSNDEYNKTVSELINITIELNSVIGKNRDSLYHVGGWYFDLPESAKAEKKSDNFVTAYKKWVEARIKLISFIGEHTEKKINYWVDYPDCFSNCSSFTTYADYFTKWINKRLEWYSIAARNKSQIYNPFIQSVPCAKATKNIQEYWLAFEKQMDAEIRWVTFLINNNENSNIYCLKTPDCLLNCKSYKTFADCYSKLLDVHISWNDFYIKNLEGVNYTWWEQPEFFTSFKDPEEYTDYYVRWFNLRLWWCDILSRNRYVFKHNNIPVWSDALKEEIKEWKNPEKHLAELTAYLKNLEPWIEYLSPHTYVIPKDMGMAELYGNMNRISEKIGPDCSAVPEKIRKLQKTNPEEYVNQMVDYINSVAENDFEKIKLVFDIEQIILTYDNETFANDMKKINAAKKGAGEDFELYIKNWKEQNKNNTEERAKQDWKTSISTGTCVCEGYARVMQYFCYKLGIKCDIVSDPDDDMMFVPGHVWNIVQIEGEDYFLDATWGLYWLFNDPEYFVKGGHFPEEPEQQLMKNPITLDEYKTIKNYKGNK